MLILFYRLNKNTNTNSPLKTIKQIFHIQILESNFEVNSQASTTINHTTFEVNSQASTPINHTTSSSTSNRSRNESQRMLNEYEWTVTRMCLTFWNPFQLAVKVLRFCPRIWITDDEETDLLAFKRSAGESLFHAVKSVDLIRSDV